MNPLLALVHVRLIPLFSFSQTQTIYQNTAEILALALLNAVCAVLGALQVVDGIKWVNALNDYHYDTSPLYTAMRLEIALSISILIFACVMAYLSYQMSRQFGWNIYKKIGADVQMQRMSFVLSILHSSSHIIPTIRHVSHVSILCPGTQD